MRKIIYVIEVNKGAQSQAETLSRRLRDDVVVDYLPPAAAGVAEQNAILEEAVRSRPDGIAVDPVHTLDHLMAIKRIREHGIPLVLFDSPSSDAGITSIGNDFYQQGIIAAERLVELIDHAGKVAIMQGCPTAPNHKQRYEAQAAVLSRHPGVAIVEGGVDNDDIETARQQATAVLKTNPDLRGYLCCDAAGPIGIATAIRTAGKVGTVKVVGMDGIRPILDAIKAGVIDSSAATIPRMQGSMSVLMLWEASVGVPLPRSIDTGIDVITQENVDVRIAAAEAGA